MSSIGTITGTSGTNSRAATTTKVLGKEDFLQMLVAQLKNQDPTNPLNGTDFAAQLAQFSSLEQLNNINTSLGNLGLYQTTASNLQAVSLIGKEVTAQGSNTVAAAGGAVKLSYRLPGDAASVSVRIYDSKGELVKTLAAGSQASGVNTVTWNAGDVPAGTYSFTVNALDATGAAMTTQSMVSGTVTAVHFKDNAVLLTVGGQDVAFTDVLSVKNASAP